MPENNEKTGILIRLDKWLWCARFYKTRSIAANALKTGKVTANGDRAKPSKTVKPGDKLDIRKGPYHHAITVLDLAMRTGLFEPSLEQIFGLQGHWPIEKAGYSPPFPRGPYNGSF